MNTSTVTGIDCHAHVIARGLPIVSTRHSPPESDATVEDFLGLLAAQGLSHGLLTAPSFYGSDNTLLLAALERGGGRLRGTLIVDPAVEDRDLVRWKALGVVGIRFNWYRRAVLPDLQSGPWRSLLRRVRELDWHVEVFIEGECLPGIIEPIRTSGVALVIDHLGCPDPRTGIASAGYRLVCELLAEGHTWVKLTGPYRLGGADPRRYVDGYRAVAGPQRLLWGSDWPWVQHADGMTYRRTLDWLAAWVPDPDERRQVLVDTPASLLGLPVG